MNEKKMTHTHTHTHTHAHTHTHTHTRIHTHMHTHARYLQTIVSATEEIKWGKGTETLMKQVGGGTYLYRDAISEGASSLIIWSRTFWVEGIMNVKHQPATSLMRSREGSQCVQKEDRGKLVMSFEKQADTSSCKVSQAIGRRLDAWQSFRKFQVSQCLNTIHF